MAPVYAYRLRPQATEWRGFAWDKGVFDTGGRTYTELVEGVICSPHHLVLATLSGGAAHQLVSTDCGHRFEGEDREGVVSFVPAHCERRLTMRGVEAQWAMVSLNPAMFEDNGAAVDIAPFTNREDPFLAGLLGEFARLFNAEGTVQNAYCETMTAAMVEYLSHRYGRRQVTPELTPLRLPAWRLRRIDDYVDAHIEDDIRIADLAAAVGVSEGHFHRAFRATTGKTPLAHINETRIRKAMQILAREAIPITAVALRVGFLSPSHFARTFRRVTGVNPSDYRGARSPRGGNSSSE